ncbi:chromosome partitioning protein ParA [Bacillus sonorensis]|nr:chromosome partitioning protein ParA [Bacillus sp. (in: firmicutes)]RHJ05943.1 chromosome partitioning protein ParA [Bacillus sonorensis]
MYNSKGYIYPAALFMAMICMLCAGHSAAVFITKQAFAKQTKEFYTQQNLLRNGVLYSVRHIQDEREREEKKAYGAVSYSILPAGKQTKLVRIKIKTAAKTVRTAEFQYHLKKKKISRWKEK